MGHGIGIVVMPVMLGAFHPLVTSRDIEAPGTALVGFGNMISLAVVMAHLMFSLVTRGLYATWVL